MFRVIVVALSLFMTSALKLSTQRVSLRTSALNSNPVSQDSFLLSELYSGPAARYNGELVSQTLKVVNPTTAKPEGYVYGAVNQDATPILAIGLLLTLAIGALVPFLLSVGEAAQSQQREREFENRIGKNRFVLITDRKIIVKIVP